MPAADVIVLGVGTCGEDLALRLLASGLEVIGVEARLVGGECPYFACLPTKSMIRSARLVQEARRADGLVGRVEVSPQWSIVAARLREEITGGWVDATAVARFESRGGRFVRGNGTLTGPRTVTVGGVEHEARQGIVISTGSRPSVPPIPGWSRSTTGPPARPSRPSSSRNRCLCWGVAQSAVSSARCSPGSVSR
jgi:Pyruvate/2-oxoglutarate dehydrogenase complex, dihydrolipoamide dehydrogenase (E3) component, and related enzymes